MKSQSVMSPLLSQLNRMNELANHHKLSGTQHALKPRFADVLHQALQGVSDLQKNSAAMTRKVELNEPGANLVETMIAMNKSSLAFQATVQVRNRLVNAYQDIMNMPI